MRTDGRKDMMKLKVAFRNFAGAPKNTFCHFARHKAEIDWAGVEPVSQVLVNNIQKFGSYLMVDTHSLDYKGEPVTGNNCSLL